MRPDGNPLDLNNLPEEYGKQSVEESSTTTAASMETARFKKKKGGKDDEGKIYECRFCALKFGKSQALGGHMNRHRQERETETLNRARQLVYGNDGMSAGGAHMGLRDPTSIGGSQSLPQFQPVYPRLPTQPAPLQPYIYPTAATHRLPYPTSYPPPHPPVVGEYFIGHALTGGSAQRQQNCIDSNYTCFGAPVSHSFPIEGVGSQRAFQREGAGASSNPIDHGKTWNCSHGQGQHSSSSSSDRFPDRF